MSDRDHAALDAHQLLPSVLSSVQNVDMSTHVLGAKVLHPLLPRLTRPAHVPVDGPVLLAAELALDPSNRQPPARTVTLVPNAGMNALTDQFAQLADLGVAAIALDMSGLADSAPYGERPWQPRSREELAELKAVAGRPFWVHGVLDALDAEVAAEAGADAVVLGAALGRYLRGPAVIDVLPEVVDAVGGTLTIIAGGPVRDGIDALKYLATGAELVVLSGDRPVDSVVAELEYAMRLTGCSDLADAGYPIIFEPLFGDA